MANQYANYQWGGQQPKISQRLLSPSQMQGPFSQPNVQSHAMTGSYSPNPGQAPRTISQQLFPTRAPAPNTSFSSLAHAASVGVAAGAQPQQMAQPAKTVQTAIPTTVQDVALPQQQTVQTVKPLNIPDVALPQKPATQSIIPLSPQDVSLESLQPKPEQTVTPLNVPDVSLEQVNAANQTTNPLYPPMTESTGAISDALNGAKLPASPPLPGSSTGSASDQLQAMLADLQKPVDTVQSQASKNALSQFDVQGQEQLRKAAEDSALGGRVATGQAGGDAFRAADQLLTQKSQLAGTLAANDEATAQQERISNKNLAVNVLSTLSSQEHDARMQKMAQDAQTAQTNLEHVLNLDTLDKQQAFQQQMDTYDKQFQSLMQDKGFNHDEAMTFITAKIQSDLSAQGYTQDQALQASQQAATSIENQKNRDLESNLATAKTLQENQQFLANFGLDQQKVALQSQKITADIANQAAQLGLDQKQVDAALKNQDFQKAMDTASILQQLYGTNADVLNQSADLIWGAMANAGLITQDQMKMGQLNSQAASFKDPAALTTWAQKNGYTEDQINQVVTANTGSDGKWNSTANVAATGGTGTENDVQAAQDKLDSYNLPASANRDALNGAINFISTAKAGQNLASIAMGLKSLNSMPGADANYNFQGSKNELLTKQGIPVQAKTQEGADYIGYKQLLDNGLTPTQAYEIATATIGADRVKAAIKAVTGKDYTA